MAHRLEELANLFAKAPIEPYGAYRTALDAGRTYDGHLKVPTKRCALILSLSGTAEFVFDGRERYKLEPGRLLFGGAGRRLEVAVGAEGFQYGLAHYFPCGAGGEADIAERLKEVDLLEAEPDPAMMRLHERLVQADAMPGGLGMVEKKALFYQLVALALRSARRRPHDDGLSVVEAAETHIRDRFMEPMSLAELAERYRMKPKYFSYVFRKHTGIGPIDYLIRVRMNRAHEWLQTGQFSVTEVARSVGYADPYYFSRLFKKYKGVAPSGVGRTAGRNRPS